MKATLKENEDWNFNFVAGICGNTSQTWVLKHGYLNMGT